MIELPDEVSSDSKEIMQNPVSNPIKETVENKLKLQGVQNNQFNSILCYLIKKFEISTWEQMKTNTLLNDYIWKQEMKKI
jgi:hypothetical protein